ncbi:OmpH family outer membrane protein [Candidatus Nitrospira bockiana]
MRHETTWGAVLGITAVLATAGAVSAAESYKVGVVDQQAVLERSKAGKRAIESLKEFTAARQRIIAVDDEELKKVEGELKSQDSGLTEQQRREKQEQFRVKFENYQRRLQDFNREIQAKQRELAQEYQKKIEQAAAAVGERMGLAAILDKGNEAAMRIVIYANGSVDVTEQVLKEFDRQNK